MEEEDWVLRLGEEEEEKKPPPRERIPKRHRRIHILPTERTDEEWSAIFSKYPETDDGYMLSFRSDQPDQYLPLFERHGFCVLQILNVSECTSSLLEMFSDFNHFATSDRVSPIRLDDPST